MPLSGRKILRVSSCVRIPNGTRLHVLFFGTWTRLHTTDISQPSLHDSVPCLWSGCLLQNLQAINYGDCSQMQRQTRNSPPTGRHIKCLGYCKGYFTTGDLFSGSSAIQGMHPCHRLQRLSCKRKKKSMTCPCQ
mgnify:CR=1 FL=1